MEGKKTELSACFGVSRLERECGFGPRSKATAPADTGLSRTSIHMSSQPLVPEVVSPKQENRGKK